MLSVESSLSQVSRSSKSNSVDHLAGVEDMTSLSSLDQRHSAPCDERQLGASESDACLLSSACSDDITSSEHVPVSEPGSTGDTDQQTGMSLSNGHVDDMTESASSSQRHDAETCAEMWPLNVDDSDVSTASSRRPSSSTVDDSPSLKNLWHNEDDGLVYIVSSK